MRRQKAQAALFDQSVNSPSDPRIPEWEILPFESEWLGRKSARLRFGPDAGAGFPASIPAAKDIGALPAEWRRQGVAFVSCRIDETWEETGSHLRNAGFVHVEKLLTFERDLTPFPGVEGNGQIEFDASDETEAAAEIARKAFVFDRFHADDRIDDGTADSIKAAWVTNAFRGRADTAAVHRSGDGTVDRFVVCERSGQAAVIDLIAVAPARHRRGIGRKLLGSVSARYCETASVLRAGTQETNRPSIGLYESLGFRVRSVSDTYHWMDVD